MLETINNFLTKEVFSNIKKNFDSNFAWFYQDSTGNKTDKSNYYFSHILFDNNESKSPYFNSILMPILGKLNFNYLHRAKLNLYTKREKQIKTASHVDFEKPHTVALFSFNTNNGYTEFEDGYKIKSIENTMVLFSGNLKHRSVNQTDENIRINLNINIKNVI